MTDEELIARLREIQGQAGLFASTAAARIEALVKRLETAVDVVAESGRLRGQAEARAERLEAAVREILEKPRNADLTYAELFAEVVSEARTALKGDDHE